MDIDHSADVVIGHDAVRESMQQPEGILLGFRSLFRGVCWEGEKEGCNEIIQTLENNAKGKFRSPIIARESSSSQRSTRLLICCTSLSILIMRDEFPLEKRHASLSLKMPKSKLSFDC